MFLYSKIFTEINNMFDWLMKECKNKAFEIMVVGSLMIIIGVCVYQMMFGSGENGTYTTKKYWELLPIREHEIKKAEQTQQGNDSKGEIECRRVLQLIFNKPFNKDRPSFLNNPVTGGRHNLELDCVDHDLKIACEYNGAQHYKYIPYFHRNKEHFQTQKYRDDMKRRLCKEEGYALIEVPYTTKIKDIENFIRTELSKARLI